MKHRRSAAAVAAALFSMLLSTTALATEVSVAVATNFHDTVQQLAASFSRGTGHKVIISAASTGKLYAQIMHGAPFDLFLAADQTRPRLLVEKGLAKRDDRRTYAEGKLALVSQADLALDDLRSGNFTTLAIANPRLAPYGLAAQQALISLGTLPQHRQRIAYGENVGQAYALVASDSASMGIVALSMTHRNSPELHMEPLPSDLYQPIRQDAVLLHRENPAAAAFFEYLSSPSAHAVIESAGYGVINRN